jgi:hypothetical protein
MSAPFSDENSSDADPSLPDAVQWTRYEKRLAWLCIWLSAVAVVLAIIVIHSMLK